MNAIQRIEKEQMNSIIFAQDDIYSTADERSIRLYNLRRAMLLGNLYKSHVNLVCTNEVGELVETEATVWAVTDQYVMLKGGITIPIKAIKEVKF